jgi:hypothetical protein
MSGALADFPGELAIVPYRGGWKLLITGPHVSGEVTTGRRDHLERIADAYAELRRADGPLLPVAGFTRLYWPGGSEAHLAHPAGAGIFCEPGADTGSMRGTGSQEETGWAAKLLTCADCRRWSRAMRAVR